jgi:hypothetical protein
LGSICRQVAANAFRKQARSLEHDPEKWKPVFRKDHVPPRNLERQSIKPEAIAL